MKEIKNDIIKKYQYKNYVIYVKCIYEELYYEFYLQNEKYGIISFMFGISKCDMEDMEEIIENNIESYIIFYKERYED